MPAGFVSMPDSGATQVPVKLPRKIGIHPETIAISPFSPLASLLRFEIRGLEVAPVSLHCLCVPGASVSVISIASVLSVLSMDSQMRYLIYDVFTDTPFEGNQLAVYPEPPRDIRRIGCSGLPPR